MTIISWSQQIRTAPIHMVLIRHQLQPVELNSSLTLAHGLPVIPWQHHPPAGFVIWALWGERRLLGGPFHTVQAIQRHKGCAQAEVVSGSTSCSQPDQPLGMLRKELLWVGTWCPLSGLAICALFTARSFHGGSCACVNYMWLDQVLHAVCLSTLRY